jgi:hypothetical protein
MFEELHLDGCLVVSSSDGFLVEFYMPLKEGWIVFREPGRRLTLSACYEASWPEDVFDCGKLPRILNIDVPASLYWNSDTVRVALNQEEKSLLLKNLRSAMEFMQFQVNFLDSR